MHTEVTAAGIPANAGMSAESKVAAPVDVLAVLARKRPPFRDAGMRRTYEACVAAYRAKGAAYMAEGNSAAVMFRRGFTGAHVGAWDAASRKTMAYAHFRAGQDCAADEARAAVAELVAAIRPLASLDLRPDGFDKRPDSQPVYARDNSVITVGDVRRAAAALSNIEGGKA